MKEFVVDKDSKVKFYHQVYLKFTEDISSGFLKPDTKLPSVRTLVKNYNLGRNTIIRAYEELEKDGYIYSLEKKGFFVKGKSQASVEPVQTIKPKDMDNEKIPTVDSIMREHNSSIFDRTEEHQVQTIVTKDAFSSEPVHNIIDSNLEPKKQTSEIILNSGDVISTSYSQIKKTYESPEDALIDSIKISLSERHHKFFSNFKPDSFGDESFRVAIAAFLYNFRKIDVHPSNIIVGADVSQLLYNLLNLPEIKKPQHPSESHGLLHMAEEKTNQMNFKTTAAALEEEDSLTSIFNEAGIPIKRIPGDDNGILIDSLISTGANLAFITSTDINPTENHLSPNSRFKELLEWAEAADYRYLIDYNKSTVYSDIISLDSSSNYGKLIYLSSFSNLISKAVNASFIVLPSKLAKSYKEKYKHFGCPVSILEQCAITDFLMKGKLRSYLENLEQL